MSIPNDVKKDLKKFNYQSTRIYQIGSQHNAIESKDFCAQIYGLLSLYKKCPLVKLTSNSHSYFEKQPKHVNKVTELLGLSSHRLPEQ